MPFPCVYICVAVATQLYKQVQRNVYVLCVQWNLSIKDTSLIRTLPVVPATYVEKCTKQLLKCVSL